MERGQEHPPTHVQIASRPPLLSLTPVGPLVRAGGAAGAAGVAGALPATVAGSPQTDAPSPESPSSPCASTHPQSV